MDDFCQYNLFRVARPPLFVPPPYARRSECTQHGERKQIPTLRLRASDPSKILLLIESLKDRCTLDLEVKINCYLMKETDSECAFLCSFQILPGYGVIKIIGADKVVPDIEIPADEQVFANIIQSKQGVDMPLESLPSVIVDHFKCLYPDLHGTDLTAYPIFEQKHTNGIAEETDVISHIVFIVNATHQRTYLYHLVAECFRFALPILTNTVSEERQSIIKERYRDVVQIGQLFFANVDNKDALLECIVTRAKGLFKCDRCDLYFVDKTGKLLQGNIACNGKVVLDEVPTNHCVIGYVYTNNKLLNINDAYNSPLFLKSEDEKCNYKTTNILCFPIAFTHTQGQERRKSKGEVMPDPHARGRVTGCIQLRNKHVGDFNGFDEHSAADFSELVALAMFHADNIGESLKGGERSRIINELMAYDCDFWPTESSPCIQHLIYAVRHAVPGFESPAFNARTVPDHRLGVAIMKMFEDLNFIKLFQIEKRELAKFVAIAELGYFDHPYHNWQRAFVSAHFIYGTVAFLTLLERKVLTELDLMALLIAAICHDIDHRGISNAFHSIGDSTLATLYASNRSVMEVHHFTQAMVVLNSEGCNFLKNLSADDYTSCLRMIKANIIASDFNEHLRHGKKQEILLGRAFRPRVYEHKMQFCALLMTCADFCDQLRDWHTVRVVASQMYEEYFHEGELEKELGKDLPSLEMEANEGDNKIRVPQLFIDFTTEVCLPAYQLLVKMYPDMQFTVDALYENLANWEKAKQIFINRDVHEITSLDLLRGPRLSFDNMMMGEELVEEENVEEEESINNYMNDFI